MGRRLALSSLLYPYNGKPVPILRGTAERWGRGWASANAGMPADTVGDCVTREVQNAYIPYMIRFKKILKIVLLLRCPTVLDVKRFGIRIALHAS